jgi:hypothetical protein
MWLLIYYLFIKSCLSGCDTTGSTLVVDNNKASINYSKRGRNTFTIMN